MCPWGKSQSEQKMDRLAQPRNEAPSNCTFCKIKTGCHIQTLPGQKESKALGQFLLLQVGEGP